MAAKEQHVIAFKYSLMLSFLRVTLAMKRFNTPVRAGIHLCFDHSEHSLLIAFCQRAYKTLCHSHTLLRLSTTLTTFARSQSSITSIEHQLSKRRRPQVMADRSTGRGYAWLRSGMPLAEYQDQNDCYREYTNQARGTPPGWRLQGTDYPVRSVDRRQPDYIPFQSINQPDGRHAYNPAGEQYPRYADFRTRDRDNRRTPPLPIPSGFPRNVTVELGINWDRMQRR